MVGLLFPGQGSQKIGMGRELYKKLTAARELLDSACEILGYNLREIMFSGAEDKLTDTAVAQPAIFTCNAMYLEKLRADGVEYGVVAGHSLGEYNALLAAGVFSFETGLRLVAARGKAMGGMNGRGTMAAVMGLLEEELQPLLDPDVVIANLNSRTQIVISGTKDGVERVCRKLEAGFDADSGIKAKELHVSAAFHSPQMATAAGEMRSILEEAPFYPPVCAVVPNVTGKPTTDINEIRQCLTEQITGQVRWADSILAMKEYGADLLYEVGYGDVLKKLNKTITFRPKCVGVEV